MTTPAELRPIAEVAAGLGISPDHVEPYGRDKAKIRLDALNRAGRAPGKLILVSAITPTPAGEGKTTTSIGLAQGLRKIGKEAVLALRQPSMGPVFGRKGGATGGGACRLTPSDQINLQFTGDFHAITAAHNLLAAAIDNRLHHGDTDLDPARVLWKRALDMNDRALRKIVIGLGGPGQGGVPRESGFDITAASEVMAILCLADSPGDLRAPARPHPRGLLARGPARRGRRDEGDRGAGRRSSRRPCFPTSSSRRRGRPPSSTAARSPTSRTAATRSWPPGWPWPSASTR